MKKILGLILAIALLLGYVAYASPYFTIARVQRAAQRGDVEAMNSHIDYPAVRGNLKAWMKAGIAAQMADKLAQEQMENPFAKAGSALGMMLVDKMIDPLVDSRITPEALRPVIAGHPYPGEDMDSQMSYEAYDRFAVKYWSRTDPEKQTTLVWRRSGLTWKLSEVRMPIPQQKATP
jgi:DUF2939 family protein